MKPRRNRRTPSLVPALLALMLSGFVRAAPPDLMLAETWQDSGAVHDYWISEKLDGVRGRWDGDTLWSRGGHRIHAPDWFTADWPAMAMDGELWIDRGRFEAVSSIVRRFDAPDTEWRKVQFRVFDLPDHEGPFTARVHAMRRHLSALDIAWLQPVAQFRLPDAEALDTRLAATVAAGGEGLMLHHQNARYRSGRSDALLKLKPFDDAEAIVVGHTQGEGKYTGMVGALVVETPDGQRFRLGSGLTDAQRADPPPIGSVVTYRFNGLTVHGTPRFARFLRVRPTE